METIGNLDKEFLELLTHQNVLEAFNDLKKSKTDMMASEDEDGVRLYAGSDNIGHEEFLANISVHSSIICDKGANGKYRFAPFKEHKTPKPPYVCVEKATKAGKEIGKANKFIRVLSMSTIRDTIFQKLMANVLDKYADDKFSEHIDLHSFGYRKEKSSKMAVKKIRRFVDNGYYHVLDGDIRGFLMK